MLTGVLSLVLAAAPLKVALLPLEGGAGVPPETAKALTQSVLGDARRVQGVSVMSPDELGSILSLERQKALMGCSEDSCVAEVAQALGVDRVLVGSVSKLGASWLLHLKLLNAANGTIASQADRRLKDKSIDDVLDALGPMVSEVFGGRGSVATVLPQKAVEPEAVKAVRQSEPGGKDDPFVFEDGKKPKFEVLTDGQGHYLLVEPFQGTNLPVFAGDAKKVYEQVVIGGGSSGDESYSFVFWDTRIPAGWQRSFEFKKDGGYHLQCAEQKVAYQPVSKVESARLLKSVQFLKQRWRRSGHTLARDDDGIYYFIDQRRDVKEELVEPRLFVGRKGKMKEVALDDVISEPGSLLALSSEGKLKINDGKAEWISGNGAIVPLTLVEFTPETAKQLYTAIAYGGQALGTACDPHL